jgi:hypothetical protein
MINYVDSHQLSPATIEFAGVLARRQEPANVARPDRTFAFARRCAR